MIFVSPVLLCKKESTGGLSMLLGTSKTMNRTLSELKFPVCGSIFCEIKVREFAHPL